jgi:hypothetical protein
MPNDHRVCFEMHDSLVVEEFSEARRVRAPGTRLHQFLAAGQRMLPVVVYEIT